MASQKFLKYLLLTVIAGNLALVAYVFLGSTTPKPTPLPNPNGYDDFVKAGELVKGNLAGFQKFSEIELATLVATNRESLKTIHAGLDRECRVPDNYFNGSEMAQGMVKLHVLASLKQAALLLNAEGLFAEKQGQTNQAAKLYLDGVQFGGKCGRGGPLIDKLNAMACETIAFLSLQRVSQSSFDASLCSEFARALESIDSKEEPVKEILNHEKQFSDTVFGLRGRFAKLFSYKSLEAGRQKIVQKIQTNQLNRRKLMIDFAARAYQLDKGKPPTTLADLVPTYLKAIPKDPATGADMVYNHGASPFPVE